MAPRNIEEVGSTDVMTIRIKGGRGRKKKIMASRFLVWVNGADMVSLSRRGGEKAWVFGDLGLLRYLAAELLEKTVQAWGWGAQHRLGFFQCPCSCLTRHMARLHFPAPFASKQGHETKSGQWDGAENDISHSQTRFLNYLQDPPCSFSSFVQCQIVDDTVEDLRMAEPQEACTLGPAWLCETEWLSPSNQTVAWARNNPSSHWDLGVVCYSN